MQHTTTSIKRRALLGAGAVFGALALTLGGAVAANAHVTADSSSAEAGAYTIVTVSVPHGCSGSPTTKIAIQMPEGVNSVTPTRNPFYTVEKVSEKLAKPITDSHGATIDERTGQVVYTAITPLPDDERDTFELSLQLPSDAAGKTLYFPTVQTCETGESAWVQIPAKGQDAHELELPAPSVTVVAASSAEHGGGSGSTAGSESASDGSAGADSPLVWTALVVGVLGLVAGGAALLRGRKQA